ncbi:hypothetical protein COA01_32460 [Bacillus cereus]|uniref:hypothetical protein n=1 Tax=Bacillus cereus TaxID=1396 RepID=UPI000BFC10ED|nr:hypothetical protein [Bacillus cereus]PGP12533.1 hypothetical protein COA01_32460 [Bacillus cereus]
MGILEKIKKDHTRKSKQVRQLRKKLRNRLPLAILKKMLAQEERHEVDWRNYCYLDVEDDSGYSKAVTIKETRIKLLKDLIRMIENK